MLSILQDENFARYLGNQGKEELRKVVAGEANLQDVAWNLRATPEELTIQLLGYWEEYQGVKEIIAGQAKEI